MPFVPHFLFRDMVGWYLALGLLAALAALFPWELGQKANPFGSAPQGIKPEWYFLFMFETLKQIPAHVFRVEGEVVGVLFFGLVGVIVLLVPLLDARAAQGGVRWMRWILSFLATVAVFFFILQTASGLDLVKFRLWQSAALSVAAAVVFLTAAAVVSRFGRKAPASTTPLAWLLALGVLAGASVGMAGEAAAPPPPAAKAAEKAGEPLAAKPNNCLFCHGNKDVSGGRPVAALRDGEGLRPRFALGAGSPLCGLPRGQSGDRAGQPGPCPGRWFP